MYVWNKRIVTGLLVVFVLLECLFWVTPSSSESSLLTHTTRWIALNYLLLIMWIFVWMVDQARVRGKAVWWWAAPFFIAPLPTLMVYVLVLQRRKRT